MLENGFASGITLLAAPLTILTPAEALARLSSAVPQPNPQP
jgi:hypothetical protein